MAQSKISIIIEAIDKSTKVLKETGSSISSWAKKNEATFKKMSVGGGAALAGIGLGVKGAMKEFGAFESRMSDISTLISGDSTEAIKGMSDGIKDLVKTIPKSADDLGASAYSIVSAGISDTGDALKVLKDSGQLAVAGLSTTAEATDIMTSAMNAFGYGADDSNKVADILFKTVKNGKTDISQMAQAFGASAPVIANAGISLEEFSAATAALTTTGLPASQAQNSLRASVIALQKPTKEMSALLTKAGYESGAAALKQDGLAVVMEQVRQSADGNTEALAKAYGSVEAFGAATALTGEQAKAYSDTMVNMLNDGNAVDEAFKKQSETFNNQTILFKNNTDALRVSVGSALLPAINGIMEAIKPVIQSVAERTEKHPELTKNIILVSAALAGVVTAIGVVGLAIPTIITGIGFFAKAFTGVTKVVGLFGTALKFLAANPVVLIIAAIAGLVAGVIRLYKNWDEVSVKLVALRDSLSAWLSQTWAKMTAWIKEQTGIIALYLSETRDNIKQKFNDTLTSIKDFFSNTRESIKTNISETTASIKETIVNWFTDKVDIVTEKLTSIKDFFKDIWEKISTALKTAWDKIKDLTEIAMRAMLAVITLGGSETLAFIIKNRDSIKEKISDALTALKARMGEFIENFKEKWRAGLDSIKAVAGSIVSAIKGVFDSAFSAIKNSASGAIDRVSDKLSGLLDFARRVKDSVTSALSSKDSSSGSTSGNRAVGGAVYAGQTYNVGELGRETFTPLVNGRIEPTGSGGGLVVNTTISGVNINNGMDMSQFKKQVEDVVVNAIRKKNLGYT